MNSAKTTRHGRPGAGWFSWNRDGKAERRGRRVRGETLRRVEVLEDRTLMAASILISPGAGLGYVTDILGENVDISVTGSIYTFSSDRIINVDLNAAGLTVVGSGSNLVTVDGITSLNIGVLSPSTTVGLASTNVPTDYGAVIGVSGPELTLGDQGDLSGIAATVETFGLIGSSSIVVDGSAGTTGGAWTLDQDGSGHGRLTGIGTGGSLVFDPALVDVLTVRNAAGQANSLTVDFTVADPLPSGSLSYDGGWTDPSTAKSDLILVGGLAPLTSEVFSGSGPGSGDIDFTTASTTSSISFTGISPHSVYDTVPALTYQFDYFGAPNVGVLLSAGENSANTGNVQTLQISSVGTPPEFPDTHVANKTSILVNQNSSLSGYSLTINYALTTPVAGLNLLTVTQAVGPDSATLTDLPPGAAIVVNQGQGNDTLALAIDGTAGTTSTTLDGGPGIDTLTIDAGGRPLSAANFSVGVEGAITISGAILPGGPISYTSYESVVVNNVGTQVPVVTAAIFRAIQGQPQVDALVGSFTVPSPALAADFAALINWGDGTTSAGVIVPSAVNPAGFDVFGTHTYTGSNPSPVVTLTVSTLAVTSTVFVGGSPVTFNPTSSSASDDADAQVTVTDLPALVPTVFGVPVHGSEGQNLVSAIVGAFTSSATATAADFAATIAWGDGSTSAGVIVQDASNPSVFYVQGTHTYYDPGVAIATAITVTPLATSFSQLVGGVATTFFRPAGVPVTQASQAIIDDAAVDVSVQAVSGFENIAIASGSSMVVGTFTDLGGVDPTDANPAAAYAATIYWGDGTAGVGALSIIRDGLTSRFIVTATPHVYATPGSYPITIVVTQADGGSTGIGSNFAVIADAPLTGTASQPTIANASEGVLFTDRVIGSFVDANPRATTDQYTVNIDWGDGTPNSAGRVIQPGGVGTTFFVIGSHTYADAQGPGVNPFAFGPGPLAGPITTNGTYVLNMSIRDTFGSALNIFNGITVVDQALLISGGMTSASDTGISHSDGVTNDATPTFTGRTNEGGATLYLYAALNGGAPTFIGSTTVDASGAWSLTPASALADGGYRISAQAYDAGGHTVSALTTLASSLVIDTVGPEVVDLLFDNFRGRVIATFADFGGVSNTGSGLVLSTVRDANNYLFTKLLSTTPSLHPWLATSITVTPGTTAGDQAATVQFNGGAGIRGGKYLFQIRSVDPSNLSGVQDIAGNALDGEFYGFFPSGNHVNGGDFVAQLDAIHHTISPPQSQVGTATPISPPGRPATGRFLRLDGALLPSAASAVRLASVRAASRPSLASARIARAASLGS
ncbi:Ig-like domain-containing protein [Paludisphaera mucosa]|uniref:Ig-like domain-containing protein n=1 Tax=Paludisphaera mucosa TaxID=3030827 RepID=A0ABT6FEM4_9BACT|nr:Ig-like domain-containing protein [Paludisphaera mucosa]MDG3006020.1 Ig-like domain-containing protein [Paludisphaera mucosa]